MKKPAWGSVPVIIAAAALVGGAICAAAPVNLLVNGDFQRGETWPEAWERKPQFSVLRAGEEQWLAITQPGGVEREILLDPSWASLRVSCRMRVTDVVQGPERWQDARLTLQFVDAQGARVGPWPDVFHASGTEDWVSHEREYAIPPGAVALRLGPHMLGLSGRVEFDDIWVVTGAHRPQGEDLPLPEGIGDPWAMETAWQTASATRGQICLNGLWRFIPVVAGEAQMTNPPSGRAGWGWFKVPGLWPEDGRRWNAEPAAQHFLLPECTSSVLDYSALSQGWYKREIAIPGDWRGRRVKLVFTMVQTHVSVLVDGKHVGGLFFPGGEVDVSNWVKPGRRHVLELLVSARPLTAGGTGFLRQEELRRKPTPIPLKGITGDVFLESEPARERIDGIHVIPSWRRRSLTIEASLSGASETRVLAARIVRDGETVLAFESPRFSARDLSDGRAQFTTDWPDPELWDPETPENMYEAIVTLKTPQGEVLDESLPTAFGFREFWIDGRDFFLNGVRTPLRALVASNMAGPPTGPRSTAAS